MHLDRRHAEDRSFLEEQFRETRAHQLSYGQIQERVGGWSSVFGPSNSILA